MARNSKGQHMSDLLDRINKYLEDYDYEEPEYPAILVEARDSIERMEAENEARRKMLEQRYGQPTDGLGS